jgi:hypothetical protein
MEVDMEFPWDRRLRILATQEAERVTAREAAEQAVSGLPAPSAGTPTPIAPDCPVVAENLTGRTIFNQRARARWNDSGGNAAALDRLRFADNYLARRNNLIGRQS